MPRRVIVGSTNPIKINAARRAFERLFPDDQFEVAGEEVKSGVSDQPMSDEETLRGATNRADAIATLHPEADYWVGIEGGSEERAGDLGTFAWVVVKSAAGEGKGRTSEFFLPHAIQKLMAEGKELKVATDTVFQTQDSGTKSGAVGWLTNDVVTRTDFYEQATILALIPFCKPNLYN